MSVQILHFIGASLRVNGTGNLRLTWKGLDDVKTAVFVPLAMQSLPGKEPTKLKNFQNQRTRLRFETTEIDEFMKINRIVLWARPIKVAYPNGGH